VAEALDNPPIGVWGGQAQEAGGARSPERRRQQVAWKGMPCQDEQVPAHFGFDLADEQDSKRAFELDRSHGELPDGSSDSALDGSEPHSTNFECNGSGRAVGSEIDPFPRSFRFSSWFEFASIIVDNESAREFPRHL
jgi:hypothetical protein